MNGELICRPDQRRRSEQCGALRKILCLKKPDNGENGRSLGFLLRYGKFQFLDLGDLTWNKEIDMVCPVNRLGKVDLLQVNHHGMDLSGAPPFVHSVGARVAVMNNGPRKGGIGSYLDIVKKRSRAGGPLAAPPLAGDRARTQTRQTSTSRISRKKRRARDTT